MAIRKILLRRLTVTYCDIPQQSPSALPNSMSLASRPLHASSFCNIEANNTPLVDHVNESCMTGRVWWSGWWKPVSFMSA